MAVNRTVSVVIPTYNMAPFVVRLLDSIVSEGLYSYLQEIYVVDDGSSDSTQALVEDWIQSRDVRKVVRLLRFEQNQGRFAARLAGAESVTGDFCIFLDARIRLGPGFCTTLFRGINDYSTLCASIQIDPDQSIFSLYWKRTHDRLFARTIAGEDRGVVITPANFADHVVGTGGLVCKRTDFLEVCDRYRGVKLESDDTAIIEDLVALSPMYRRSDFFVYWEPRQSWSEFLSYIFVHRGITFAEYHVLKKRGVLSYVFLAGAALFLVVLFCFVTKPFLALSLAATSLLLMTLSTAAFARTVSEFIILAPLHTAVILAYGLGALAGLIRLGSRRVFKTWG